MKIIRLAICIIYCLTFSYHAFAEIILPKVISNNMVIQRNKSVKIWGKAAVGEKVTVSFANQHLTCITDTCGSWSVSLLPLKASVTPAKMTIAGNNTIVLENILVGDVWLCSGQSNMEYRLDRSLHGFKGPESTQDLASKELAIENKTDQIRFLYVQKKTGQPEITTTGWHNGNDTITKMISTIGYFFAKEINAELNIPVGIISSSWGGTKIEEWTSIKAYQRNPSVRPGMEKPGQKFASMIAPIIPFTIKGLLWYQGESNIVEYNDSTEYTQKFKAMVEDWRIQWNCGNWPVYYVQIAPYYYTKRKDKVAHTPENLPLFWEAQTKCLEVPNSGMVVVTDLVNNLNDIHPWNKWDIAHRLALLTLAKDEGRKIEYSGPVFKRMKIKKNKIYLDFDHAANGLVTKDGQQPTWFSIAGADGRYYPANAQIVGRKIVLSATEVPNPVHVRFAWNEAAQPNLFNKEGLPAVPFRTK
jgi:sialate O-acetylesterase